MKPRLCGGAVGAVGGGMSGKKPADGAARGRDGAMVRRIR